MTFAELKARILSTSYLPLWLKNGISTTQPVRVEPKLVEPDPADLGWCPMSRSVSVKFDAATNSAKPTVQHSHNRLAYIQQVDGLVSLKGVAIEANLCIGNRCQMWDATGSDCGLKNPLLHVRSAVAEAKTYLEELNQPTT